MTTAAKPTTIRVDETLKAQANEILGSIGLSYNAYVVLATHQLVNQRRIPFEMVAASETKEPGFLPEETPTCGSANDPAAKAHG